MKLFEMEGFLRGKCLPGDMKVNETNAEYLVRKFAEADAKCAALAAENANCRKAVQVFCDVVDANTDAICEEVGQDGVKAILAAMSATGNMPATDAFLAEVRAQGVEMFASKCKEESKRAHSSATRDSWWVSGENADDFAAQLRKGVQS
ncbi:hypothetical protein RM421_000086 [Enterobacter kobei]|nr:hypothetical protein [Enterobacter kobei]